jgi:tagatose 6-phosphate kinase
MTFANLTIDAVNRATEVAEYASGKNINAARVAKTIGEEVVATGFLGGIRGQLIRDDLDRAGIAHDFVDVAPNTRMCTTVIDRSGDTATELIEEAGKVPAEDGERLLARLADLLREADVLVLSGRIARGLDSNFYARCLALAREHEVATIVDAVGEALKLALYERPTVVKPNRSELAATLDTTIDSTNELRDAIRELTNRFGGWVIVTNGSSATTVSNGKDFHEIATPQVEVISPIGSGDALAAGLAAGIVRGWDVLRAATLGVACGAANVMTPLAGHVESLEVARLENVLLSGTPRRI